MDRDLAYANDICNESLLRHCSFVDLGGSRRLSERFNSLNTRPRGLSIKALVTGPSGDANQLRAVLLPPRICRAPPVVGRSPLRSVEDQFGELAARTNPEQLAGLEDYA